MIFAIVQRTVEGIGNGLEDRMKSGYQGNRQPGQENNLITYLRQITNSHHNKVTGVGMGKTYLDLQDSVTVTITIKTVV